MGTVVKVQELRELLKLAKELREASATAELRDVGLFLRTAFALEERASLLAFGVGDATWANFDEEIKLHAPIDICA